jgi:hypothetical protein
MTDGGRMRPPFYSPGRGRNAFPIGLISLYALNIPDPPDDNAALILLFYKSSHSLVVKDLAGRIRPKRGGGEMVNPGQFDVKPPKLDLFLRTSTGLVLAHATAGRCGKSENSY